MTQHPRAFVLLVVICCLAGVLTGAGHAAQQSRATDERGWIDDAERLVKAAASARTKAVLFQGQVDASRDRLRALVKAAAGSADPAIRDLHVTLVLVSALLQSAASCQRAGQIVCPAYLLTELRNSIAESRRKWNLIDQAPPTPGQDRR